MFTQKLKKMTWICLVIWGQIGIAGDVGYIKHQFLNRTNQECYIDVHQKNSYPIESCLGTVSADETKTCEGVFEPHQPNFYLYVICDGLQQDKKVFLKNTYKAQNIEVIWTIDVIKKKLWLNYHEHGF